MGGGASKGRAADQQWVRAGRPPSRAAPADARLPRPGRPPGRGRGAPRLALPPLGSRASGANPPARMCDPPGEEWKGKPPACAHLGRFPSRGFDAQRSWDLLLTSSRADGAHSSRPLSCPPPPPLPLPAPTRPVPAVGPGGDVSGGEEGAQHCREGGNETGKAVERRARFDGPGGRRDPGRRGAGKPAAEAPAAVGRAGPDWERTELVHQRRRERAAGEHFEGELRHPERRHEDPQPRDPEDPEPPVRDEAARAI